MLLPPLPVLPSIEGFAPTAVPAPVVEATAAPVAVAAPSPPLPVPETKEEKRRSKVFPDLFVFFVHGVSHSGVSDINHAIVKVLLKENDEMGYKSAEQLVFIDANEYTKAALDKYDSGIFKWSEASQEMTEDIALRITRTKAKVLVITGEMFVLPSIDGCSPIETRSQLTATVIPTSTAVAQACERRKAATVSFTHVATDEDLAANLQRALFDGRKVKGTRKHAQSLAALYNTQSAEDSQKHGFLSYTTTQIQVAIIAMAKLSLV